MRRRKTFLKTAIPFIFIFFLGCQPESRSTESLFREYFTVSVPPNVVPRAGVAAANVEQQAFRLLEEGNYEQAALLFSELSVRQRSSGYMLYRGMALLAEQRSQAARASLQQVRPEAPEHPTALWYTALAWLQEGKADSAATVLRQLIQDSGPASSLLDTQAQQLLDQL